LKNAPAIILTQTFRQAMNLHRATSRRRPTPPRSLQRRTPPNRKAPHHAWSKMRTVLRGDLWRGSQVCRRGRDAARWMLAWFDCGHFAADGARLRTGWHRGGL